MNKDVTVIITGTQYNEENKEGDTVKTNTSGSYYKKNDKHYVLYEEDVDKQVSKTILKFNENIVVMNKSGAMNTTMVFEKDKKNITAVNTPFGSMLISIDTKEIDIKQEENNIELTVKYEMQINEEYSSDCIISALILDK